MMRRDGLCPSTKDFFPVTQSVDDEDISKTKRKNERIRGFHQIEQTEVQFYLFIYKKKKVLRGNFDKVLFFLSG